MSFRRFYDPDGERYDLPTWPWGHAPAHLVTRTQLAAYGLRPGGHEPVGQLMWHSRRARATGGVRAALLYDTALALPKRVCTPAMAAGLARAMQARRTCPACTTVFDFCIPTSLGCCPDCHRNCEGSTA